eukprot:CCRYP_003117-RA/>CCRYP_003117-RA protein AED:0.26 eAED:0.33 QI:0/0/0/1/0/0/3/0/307
MKPSRPNSLSNNSPPTILSMLSTTTPTTAAADNAFINHCSARQQRLTYCGAYAQAPIECDMYMELPPGIETQHGNSKDYVLKLLANLYGQSKQGGLEPVHGGQTPQSSLIGECVFYRDDIIFIVYVDDGLFFGSDDDTLSLIIKRLRDSGLNIEDQGHPADYVGVNIKRTRDGNYEFTQRALIDAIIDDVNIGDSYTKPVPAKVTLQLHAFRDSPKFQGNFNYRSAVGKLNYLGQTTRPDIMYAVHQVAKYSADPRQEHGEAIVYIVKYLKATASHRPSLQTRCFQRFPMLLWCRLCRQLEQGVRRN